jgi:hypothetical protein
MKKVLLVFLGLIILGSVGALIYINSDQISKQSPQSRKNGEEKRGGLVAHWSFDEGKGSSSFDLSNDLEARIKGPTWTIGIKGSALEFDGIDDFVEFEQSALKMVGGLEYGTVSLWFKFKKPGPKKILPIFFLGRKELPEEIDGLTIEIGHFDHGGPPDQKLYYTIYNKGYKPVLCFDSATNLKSDTWYHFAVVNSESGNTGYLNGKELANRHYNFGSAKDNQFFNILHKRDIFKLGTGYFGIDQKFHFFDGVIDEVKVYGEPLGIVEIEALATP